MYLTTQVKNQGTHCAQSSWAFSATGAIEGQYYRTTGQLVSLSEQQLIDCSCDYGNAGCKGGHMVNAFKYVVANGGICEESDYTYLGYVRLYNPSGMYGWVFVLKMCAS